MGVFEPDNFNVQCLSSLPSIHCACPPLPTTPLSTAHYLLSSRKKMRCFRKFAIIFAAARFPLREREWWDCTSCNPWRCNVFYSSFPFQWISKLLTPARTADLWWKCSFLTACQKPLFSTIQKPWSSMLRNLHLVGWHVFCSFVICPTRLMCIRLKIIKKLV